MASHERETRLLPSELFHQEDHDVSSEDYSNNSGSSSNNNSSSIMVSPKGLRSLESNFSFSGSACSSWSEFSSPISSELGSTSESNESEEDDQELFISELTRQMAEYMLQDDDDDDDDNHNNNNNNNNQDHESSVFNYVPENCEIPTKAIDHTSTTADWSKFKSGSVCYYNSQGFMNKSENPTSDPASAKNLNTGIHPDDDSTEEQFPPVQIYQLKNQPQMRKQGSYGGRRAKATESTQQQQLLQHKEQQSMQNKGKAKRYGHTKKPSVPLFPTHPAAGSGMRAVFLGGSERNGSSGTGVFLPSATYSTPEPKRKSGCSTVLIPARVLQALQQHFNTVGALSPSNAASSAATNLPWQNEVLARINGLLSQRKEHAEFQTRPAAEEAETNHLQDVQLPQEWTY